MAQKRYAPITWTAEIQGGNYPMAGLQAASNRADGWRIVAIPGTPSRDYVFYRFLARAPEYMEVTMVTRAGYGGGAYGEDSKDPVLDFNDQVKAIAPLFEKSDGKKTIILGVSYGGALALKCALDYPNHIHGAMTVAMLVHEPRTYVKGAIRLGGVVGINHALPQYLKNARREVIGRREQIGPLFARLKTMHQPVTILHGNRDNLVPLSAAKDLQGYFTDQQDVQFQLVQNGTHYLECERPNMLYEEIEKLKARINE